MSIGLFGYYIFVRSQDLLIQSSKDKLLTASQILAHRFSDAITKSNSLPRYLASLLAARSEYAQIRLINAAHHGKELVRVDRDLAGIKIVTGPQLQEKSHFLNKR